MSRIRLACSISDIESESYCTLRVPYTTSVTDVGSLPYTRLWATWVNLGPLPEMSSSTHNHKQAIILNLQPLLGHKEWL